MCGITFLTTYQNYPKVMTNTQTSKIVQALCTNKATYYVTQSFYRK